MATLSDEEMLTGLYCLATYLGVGDIDEDPPERLVTVIRLRAYSNPYSLYAEIDDYKVIQDAKVNTTIKVENQYNNSISIGSGGGEGGEE